MEISFTKSRCCDFREKISSEHTVTDIRWANLGIMTPWQAMHCMLAAVRPSEKPLQER